LMIATRASASDKIIMSNYPQMYHPRFAFISRNQIFVKQK
jgi:hypothetical protein